MHVCVCDGGTLKTRLYGAGKLTANHFYHLTFRFVLLLTLICAVHYNKMQFIFYIVGKCAATFHYGEKKKSKKKNCFKRNARKTDKQSKESPINQCSTLKIEAIPWSKQRRRAYIKSLSYDSHSGNSTLTRHCTRNKFRFRIHKPHNLLVSI